MQKGSILNKKYKVILNLKSKGKNNVFLVEHVHLHTLWVVKEWRQCLHRPMPVETILLAKLNHHSIPKVVDYFEENSNQYMVEEFFEGDTLESVVKDKGKVHGRKSLEWMYALSKVLTYIHEMKPFPIIHGDIKPSNIIVSSDETIKLIDFGASKCKALDMDYRCFGTEGYAAPEQNISTKIDQRSDIYGIGQVMYYILIGQHPKTTLHFQPERNLSKNISQVIHKCTFFAKELRYANVRELENDICKLLYQEETVIGDRAQVIGDRERI